MYKLTLTTDHSQSNEKHYIYISEGVILDQHKEKIDDSNCSCDEKYYHAVVSENDNLGFMDFWQNSDSYILHTSIRTCENSPRWYDIIAAAKSRQGDVSILNGDKVLFQGSFSSINSEHPDSICGFYSGDGTSYPANLSFDQFSI